MATWSDPRFPPAPPSSPPTTLAYQFPSRPATPPCSPTLPCPPTQMASPSTPSIPSTQPRQSGTPYSQSPRGRTTADDSRIYGFDPNPQWQEDQDHYANQKINGLTFPRCIRPSAFTQKLDIEGCDPLKLRVAALLYQQANNFWLRKLAHGRELYLIPTGDIAAVVFMTELLTQLRNKGVDLDKVSSCKARQDGKLLDKTNNTKYAAQQIADLIHSWVPTRTADPETQHELTQLRSQLAQLRQQLGETPGDLSNPGTTGPSASSPTTAPIHAALLRSSQSTSSTTRLWSFLSSGWNHHCESVARSKYATYPCSTSLQQNKWLKELDLSDSKRKVLTDNITKTEEWWANQPAEALETVERVAVMMGIPVHLMSKNYEALNLLRAMTAGISLTNWLAPLLRQKLKHKVLQSHLQILHSMILIIYILTPFTMTYSIHLFQGFRIIQTRMMVLAILHGPRPNLKLKSILEGCVDLQHLWGTTLHSHNLFSRQFFQPQSVYIRFTHIKNMQPKFYLGSAMHHTLDREYSRSRKYFQLTNERLVQAELALRYWQDHDNLYIWAPIPIYTNRVDYRSLEMALIQEWQPRLSYPFICQVFHPKKGLLKKPLLNTNAQFGLATLWRRAKHKFTPQLVRHSSDLIQVSKPIGTLDNHSRLWFEHQGKIRANEDASIQRWWAHFVLCSPSTGQQHSGTFPYFVFDRHWRIYQMVAWKTSPEGNCLAGTMVPCTRSSYDNEKVPTTMARQDVGPSSTLPHSFLQDGFHQTCRGIGHPLQSQTGHWGLVDCQSGRMLLQILVPLQECGTQPFRSTLDPIGRSSSIIASTWPSLSNKVFPSKKEFHNQMRLGFKTWRPT